MTHEPGAAPRRLFFALWPDEVQRCALEHNAAKAVRHSGGRPVAAANLHVTLLDKMGVRILRLGDSTGEFDDLSGV